MINKLLSLVLRLFLAIFSFIASLIFRPISLLLIALFPDISIYLTIFAETLEKFLNGIAFAKCVFCNVTGFPDAFITLLADLFIARITFRMATMIIRFIRNLNAIRLAQRMEE